MLCYIFSEDLIKRQWNNYQALKRQWKKKRVEESNHDYSIVAKAMFSSIFGVC